MKRVISFLLSIVMVLSMLPVGAFAAEGQWEETTAAVAETVEETTAPEATAAPETEAATEPSEEIPEETVTVEKTVSVETAQTAAEETTEPAKEPTEVFFEARCIPDADNEDNELLLQLYLEDLFYDNRPALFGTAARAQLGAEQQKVYDYLKGKIEKVASGELSTSYFAVDGATLDNWGLERTYSGSDYNEAAGKFYAALDMDNIISALLHDCPYELYWFNKVYNNTTKTGGFLISMPGLDNQDGTFSVANATFIFTVVKDLQGSGYSESKPVVDTTVAASAKAAAENAKDIVDSYADASVYNKLAGFRDEICSLVSYNHSAASANSFSTDADPWQLIWVFDGDSSTDVVCEGYSKAFQYLCDEAGGIDCYTVTGQMSGGTGAGLHMWNVVTLDGKNYLVDITNSDVGTAGSDGSLFLAGTSGSVSDGYMFDTAGGDIVFTYDDETKYLWNNSGVLTLADSGYEPPVEPEETVPNDGTFEVNVFVKFFESDALQNLMKLNTISFEGGYDVSEWLAEKESVYDSAFTEILGHENWTWESRGIYYDADGNQLTADDLILHSDLDVYIHVMVTAEEPTEPKESATISFINARTGEETTMTVLDGQSLTGLPSAKSVAGYRFVGWFSGENGMGEQINEGDSWNKGMPTAYYACYQEDAPDDELCTLSINAKIFQNDTLDRIVKLLSQDFSSGENMYTWLSSNEDQIAEKVGTVVSNYYGDTEWSWEPRNYYDTTDEVLTESDLIADGNKMVYIHIVLADTEPDYSCGENLTWAYDEATGTLTISGTGDMYDYSNEMTPWHGQDLHKQIKSVVMEEGVTSISHSGFVMCTALETVTIPDSITSIGELAFQDCTALKKITFAGGMPSFGRNAFLNVDASLFFPIMEYDWHAAIRETYGAKNLTWIPYGEHGGQCGDNLYWVYDANWASGNLWIEGTGEMYNYADGEAPWFANDLDAEIDVVNIGNGATSIGANAFAGIDTLEYLTVGKSVTGIGAKAFKGCQALKMIGFLGDAPTIAEDAFINVSANAEYPGLNQTWTADKLKTYGGSLNWAAAYDIDDSGSCGSDVTYMMLGDGILIISGTGNMENYSQASSAPWADYAGDITKLIIEDGVTGIGSRAFADCDALVNVELPASLTRVGDSAFCTDHEIWYEIAQTVRQWSTVEIGADNMWVPHWDCTTFVNEAPIVDSGKFGENVYWELKENGTMEIFGTGNMYLFGATGSYVYDLPVKTVNVAEGVTDIGECLFEAGAGTILSQSLESIVLPTTVQEIGIGAFRDLAALKTVTFTGDAPEFGEVSFCGVTATVYYPADNATWTADVMQNYGGNLTWVAVDPEMDQTAFDDLLDNAIKNGDGWPMITERVALTEDITLKEDTGVTFGEGSKLIVPSGVTLTVNSELFILGELVVEEGGAIVIRNLADSITDENWLYLICMGTAQVDGSMTIEEGSSFLVSEGGTADFGATSTVDNRGTFCAQHENARINLGGTLTNECNAFALRGGQLDVLPSGVLNNRNNPMGQILLEDGSMNMAGILNNESQIALINGGKMTVSGTLNNHCGLGIGLGGDKSTLELTGTLNSTHDQEGLLVTEYGELLVLEGGNLNLDGKAQNFGSVIASNGGKITISGKLTNYGDIEISSSKPVVTLEIAADGVLENLVMNSDRKGQIVITESGAVTVQGTLTNKAYLENNGALNINGTLKNEDTLKNTGTIVTAADATFTNGKKAVVENTGSLLVGGADAEPFRAEITLGGTPAVEITVPAGISILLEGSLLPGNPTGAKVAWSVSDESLATLRPKGGNVFLNAADVSEVREVYVTAGSSDGLAEEDTLKVVIIPETRAMTMYEVFTNEDGNEEQMNVSQYAFIYINLDEEQMANGLQIQMEVEAEPIGAEPKVKWSTDNSKVAYFEDETNGVVTFTGKPGTVKLTAAATDGSGIKETVIYKAVAPVSVVPDGSMEIELLAGKSQTLKILNQDTGAKLDVEWSFIDYDEDGNWYDTTEADSVYATINSKGKLTARKVSEYAELTLRGLALVDDVPVGEVLYTVKINPATIYVDIVHGNEVVNGRTLYLDTTNTDGLELSADIHPVDAKNAVVWKSSNEKIATVENGVVKPVPGGKTGTVTITATNDDGTKKKATVKVEVGTLTQEVNVIAPETLYSKDKVTLTHNTGDVTPSKGGVTWSIIEGGSYATINSKGQLKANAVTAPQKVVVVATSKDAARIKSDPVTITILPKTLETLNLVLDGEIVTGATWNAEQGDWFELSAKMFYNNGDEASLWDVEWSVKGSGAQLSADSGDTVTVTVGSGKATIKATGINSDGDEVTASITVKAGILSDGVDVTSAVETLASGKSVTLKASIAPANATNKKLTWSIVEGEEFATISSKGKLTAAKDLTSRQKVVVQVEAQDGASEPVVIPVTITPLAQSVEVYANLGYDGYDYSYHVTGLTWTWTVLPGEKLTMSAIVYPNKMMVDENGTHDLMADQTVLWSSSNKKILDIHPVTGEVTFGEKTGSVTVTATAQDGSKKKATFKLKVVRPILELEIRDGVISGGKTLKLSSLTEYMTENATSKKLYYEIIGGDGAAFAGINKSGQLKTKKVTSLKEVEIVAYDDYGYVFETFTVYIRPSNAVIDLTSGGGSNPAIDVTNQTVELAVGDTLRIKASTWPAPPCDSYSWKVSSAKYAGILTEDGTLAAKADGTEIEVKGIKAGKTVTITATAIDGSGRKSTMKIKVVEP